MTKERIQQQLHQVLFEEKRKKAERDKQERLFEAERTRLHYLNADLNTIRARKLQLQAALEGAGKGRR